MLISPLPTRGDIILKKGLEAGVMNVEWKSKIDMLKAYPIAIHDSSIYSDGRLACFFFFVMGFLKLMPKCIVFSLSSVK